MKKIIYAALGAIILVTVTMAVMFFAKICPPKGPWPMPPWCAYKSESIVKDSETTATFFVSVPLPAPENLQLTINNHAPIQMEKVSESVFSAQAPVKGWEEIVYSYHTQGDELRSRNFRATIRQNSQKILNGLLSWQGQDALPVTISDFEPEIFMMDTWGGNYNFNMFENTRDNIASAFDRVKATGAKTVTVTDMQQAYYNNKEQNYIHNDTNYEIKDAIFKDDLRDEALTAEDMKNLVAAARQRGLKINAEMSLSMRNIGKLLTSGDVIGTDAKFWEEFAKPKSRAWTEDFFNKYEARILERARMLDLAGFDAYYITPRGLVQFHPYESYANDRFRQIINTLHQQTKLKIFVFLTSGWLSEDWQEDWGLYDYYKLADRQDYIIEFIPEKYHLEPALTYPQLTDKFHQYLDDISKRADQKGIKIHIVANFSSYSDAIAKGYVEFNDIMNEEVKSLKTDFAHQANCYDALFAAMIDQKTISGLTMMGYWWDNAMDPDSAKPRISISASPRNKPAEAVFIKWANLNQD